MPKVVIKPLSVNKCWKGKRYKTKEYIDYENALQYLLPNLEINNRKKLKLDIVIGYSNTLADIDNFIKPFLDILQNKYKFNDNKIYELHIFKEIVNKNEEFIDFEINEIK